jgi:hypothetical protein
LAFAERTYGKDDEHYTALIRKKEQLDQQYAAKSQQIALRQGAQWDQLTRKMSATFESTINKLVMGEEGWAQVSKELYGQVASAFVTNSVKMVEQEVVAAVTHKSLLKTEILGDAKAAAAGAYKAMAGIPIVGPELGAAAAAATFAAVVALGSFETGGLALQTGPYILHEGEGVMTKRQTAAIERAGEVTNNSGARNFHQEVTLNHNGSNLSDAGFAKIMHRVMRKGLFSLR